MGLCMCIRQKKDVNIDGAQYFTNSVSNNNVLKFGEHAISELDTNGSITGMVPASNNQLPIYNFNTNNAISVVGPHNEVQSGCLLSQNNMFTSNMLEMPVNNSVGLLKQSLIRVRALYTYQGQNPGDLSFQKGDIMFVESDNTDSWWFAIHPVLKRSGYIPSNYVRPNDGLPTSLDAWYDIGRREADRMLLLAGNVKGTYIIRPCSGTFQCGCL